MLHAESAKAPRVGPRRLLPIALTQMTSRDDNQAPRGTLYIVAVFGGLVVVGWMLMYFVLFLPRSTP